MDTIHKGNAAEAAVLNELIHAGIHVIIPFGGGLSFDIGAVVPPEGNVLRIQVKCGRIRSGCVEFNSCSTDHGSGRQDYNGRADILAVYVQETRSTFMVPPADVASYRGYLRLETPRNNQRRRIRFATDYTLENWLERLEKEADAHRPHLRHPHAEGEPEAA